MSKMSNVALAIEFTAELVKDFALCDLVERAIREDHYQDVLPDLQLFFGENQVPETLAARPEVGAQMDAVETEDDRFDPDISEWESEETENLWGEAQNFQELYGVSIMSHLFH